MAGRPSKYKKEFVKVAQTMCEMGATIYDLSQAFDISRETLNQWMQKYKAFSDAIRTSREPANRRVEASLYERACGYTHDDVDIRVIEGRVVQTPIKKHYPPETKAAMVWLFNRMPDKWHPMPKGNEADAVNELSEALNKLAEKLPD